MYRRPPNPTRTDPLFPCTTLFRSKGATAWGLLSAAVDPARMQAEELRQRLDALRFAKIPGYFPTPAELIARMIDAAGDVRGKSILEPSAGSGAIADALRDEIGRAHV